MAAELRLNVALDLQYFKRQLPKLSRAAAGFQLPIQVKFDSRQVRKELNKLTGRREFRININDTAIKSALENTKKLQTALKQLEVASKSSTRAAAPVGTRRLSRTTSQGGFSAAEIRALYQQAATEGLAGFKAGVRVNRKDAELQLGQLAADALKGLVGGLKKGQGKVGAASEGLAEELIDSMETRLQISSPSRRLMEIGRQAAKGFEIGMSKGLKRAQTAALSQLQAMLIAMQAEVRSFGGGSAQITAMSRGAAAAPAGMMTSATGRPRFRASRVGDLNQVAGAFGRVGSVGGGPGRGSFMFAPRQLPGAPSPLALPSGEMRASARAAMLQSRMAAAQARGGSTGSHFHSAARGGGRMQSALPPAAPAASPRRAGGPSLRGVAMPGQLPNLPGASAVRGLASEFSNATKQVLLFGTAYKGLAFFMDFPSQVGAAVGALQSFNNTLAAISPTAEDAAKSNAFILSIVDRYNVPLQSARDGFTKLYASMAPAGFEGEEIKELFLGISQAAATFGMSSDKVDRMNYAFAQMASKGQIMSEELKGQLGDVLPGAMGIFAEAAGLEGPDAIQKFTKALEDGAFQGENMTALLKNVGQVLQDEFGPGAEGAARTFQGLMNRLQTSLTLLYEAFEPLAVQFLNTFVVPLSEGIKTVTDGFKAFFSGTAAETAKGQAFADKLNEMRGAFAGIRANVITVIETLKQFGAVLLPILQITLQIAASPFVGFLARMYLIMLPLVKSFVLLKAAFVAYNSVLFLTFGKLSAFRALMITTGKSAAVTSLSVRRLGLALKSVFASTGIGVILLGIGMLIEKIVTLKGKMDDVKRSAQEAAASIAFMSRAEAIKQRNQAEADLVTLRGMNARRGPTSASMVQATDAEKEALERAGVTPTSFKNRKEGGAIQEGTTVSGIGRALEQTQGRINASRDRVIQLDKEEAESKLELERVMGEISLDGSGDGSGSGAEGQKDMSAEMVRLTEKLRGVYRGLLNDQEGITELMRIEAEFQLNKQRVLESTVGQNQKNQEIKDLELERDREIARVNEQSAEEAKRAAEERLRLRDELFSQAKENLLAAGELTQEEFDRYQIAQDYRKELERIERLIKDGVVSEEEGANLRSIAGRGRDGRLRKVDEDNDMSFGAGLKEWVKETEKELKDFKSMAKDVANGIADEFGSAFSGILQGTMSLQEGLGQAFTNIGAMFADMVAQMLVKYAMVQFLKFAGFAEGGIVNASSGGGAPSFVPGFATGGVVTGPTMAMVGEGRFNEAIVPLPNGKSIPVEMNGGAGNNIATNITVNVNNGQASSQSSGKQGNNLARNLEGAVKQVIMREMQPGGMISSKR